MDPRRTVVHRARLTALVATAGATLLLAPRPAAAQLPEFPDLPVCEVAPPSPLTSPFVHFFVGSICLDLTDRLSVVEPGKIWSLDTGPLTLASTVVDIDATFNADPFVTFGISTTNATNLTQTYAVLFGTPIEPGLYSSASSSGGVSVTPGATGSVTVDNSEVYPTYISGWGTVGLEGTNLGVDLGTEPCTATGTATTTCNQGTAENSFAPTFYDNLEALLTYTQTDGGSVASWSGRVDLFAAPTTVVPEPGTFVLVVTGLAAVGGVGVLRRRRR